MNLPLKSKTGYSGQSNIKVPKIIAIFWLTKILTTGLGEIFSDYLFETIDPQEIAAAMGLLGIVIALIIQFRSRRYNTWIYWITVIMVSIFGTMLADIIHFVLHVPLILSTAFFILAQAVIFIIWYASEKTLSIHSIFNTRREAFYWATVLVTFALGTAAGDLAANSGLDYLQSGLLFSGLILIVAIAYKFFKLKAIPAFWIAYILTRPIGASFADWMGFPPDERGLGWGAGPVSLVLSIIIFLLMTYLAVTRKDVPDPVITDLSWKHNLEMTREENRVGPTS